MPERQKLEDMGLTPAGDTSTAEREPESEAPKEEPRHEREPPQPGGRSTKATAALVCGIVSILVAGVILGLVAIVLGVLARRDMASNSRLEGSGLATAGIVLGAIGFVLSVVLIAVGGPSVF